MNYQGPGPRTLADDQRTKSQSSISRRLLAASHRLTTDDDTPLMIEERFHQGPNTMMDILDPFELVDSPWGHIERWRALTLATGTMGALAQRSTML